MSKTEPLKKLKPIDYELVSELMKNPRLSDRQVAKKLGVSQPTVTRRRGEMETEKLLDYTAIPDLKKLGFEIIAVTLGKRNYQKHPEINLKKAKDFAERHPEIIFGASGNGLGYDKTSVSIHRNYSDYSKFVQEVRNEWVGIMDIDSFIISLKSTLEAVEPLSLKHFADTLKNEKES
jgi:Lrp/AsnC family leucine-responsive transcriptional regulator